MPKLAYSKRGVVVSDHPYATLAGLRMLEAGGNAFDACIAMSAVLGVVLPYTSGIGGDAFILAKTKRGVEALNSSGKYAENLDETLYKKLLNEGMPERGPYTITVPGLVAAWQAVVERYCNMGVRELLGEAIKYASGGFPVSRSLCKAVEYCRGSLGWSVGWRELYGDAREGEPLIQRGMARVLEAIANKGFDDFYLGETASQIVKELKQQNCPLTASDFENHRAVWVSPLTIRYAGYSVHELPPNTQGITALQLVKLYEIAEKKGEDLQSPANVAKIATLAYHDRNRYVADPDKFDAPLDMLLSEEYLERCMSMPLPLQSPEIIHGDTTFLAAADEDGNTVGFIQSLYYPFGSGVVALGIPFQNRGFGFDTRQDSPNRLEPGKRPRHTLSVMLAEKDDRRLCIGCAGADLRPQLHAYTLIATLREDLPLETAVSRPRTLAVSDKSGIYLIKEEQKRQQTVIDGIRIESIEYPSTEVGIVNALDIRGSYMKAVADPRSEGVPLPL